eukprot:IDg30t1
MGIASRRISPRAYQISRDGVTARLPMLLTFRCCKRRGSFKKARVIRLLQSRPAMSLLIGGHHFVFSLNTIQIGAGTEIIEGTQGRAPIGDLRVVAAESSLAFAKGPLLDWWRAPFAKRIVKHHRQGLPCGRLSLSASSDALRFG